MALENVIQPIKDFYYFFEDRYYELLDRINEKIPVYNIVDPIDRYFPSFILVILFFIILLFLFLLLLFGGHGGPLEPVVKFIADVLSPVLKLFGPGGPLEPIGKLLGQIFGPVLKFFGFTSSPAKFVVVDDSSKPVSGISVNFSQGKKTESKKTDSSGELTTEFYGKGISVVVDDKRYKKYSDTLDIQAEKLYRIKLSKTVEVKTKQIGIELRDEERNLIAPNVNVTLSFSCNNPGIAPQPVKGTGPNHRVSVQTNCGMLTVSVSATGYIDARDVIDVTSFDGTKAIRLSKKKTLGTVRVTVKDKADLAGISGTKIKIKSGGITVIDGGYTDEGGSKIIPNVPMGTYTAEAIPPEASGYGFGQSDEFVMGAAEFSGDGLKTIEILLEKPTNAKKALLKFLDSQSNTAVKGVSAGLIVGAVNSGISNVSAEDGTVAFINLDPEKKYASIAVHPEYVRKFIPSLELKASGDTKAQEVKIEKATSANSGAIKVIVADYSRKPVANASVAIYEKTTAAPFIEGETDAAGIFEAKNMPPGNYYAEAVKYIDEAKNTGKSAKADLKAGKTLELPITLVLSSGELAVKVVDVEGKAVAGANVYFYDSATGKRLEKRVTQASGLAEPVKFKADVRPKLGVEKEGYFKTETGPITIDPDVKKTETVTLVKIPEPPVVPEFKVEMEKVFKEDGKTVADKIEPGKNYVFKFRLESGNGVKGLKSVFRAGLQSQVNAADSPIAITQVNSSSAEVVYSSCFNNSDNYSDCSISSGEAKQAVISFGDVEKVVYMVLVSVKIRQVPADQVDKTVVEMRWGARGNVAGAEVYKPKIDDLYVWSATLNKPICKANCGISIIASLNDGTGDTPVNEGTLYKLLEGNKYTLTYSIWNLSGKGHSNVIMRASNKNTAVNPLDITYGAEKAIGDLGANQQVVGPEYKVEFTASKPASEADLMLSMNLGQDGDTFAANFAVDALQELIISLQPASLPEKTQSNLLVTVRDSKGPVAGAEVKMYLNPDDPTSQIAKEKNYLTDASGIAQLLVPAFDAGTKIFIVAEKLPNYKRSAKEIQFTSMPEVPKEIISCVKVSSDSSAGDAYDSSGPVIPVERQGSASFRVTNECGKEVEVKLSKDSESDIVVKDSLTRLSESANESDFLPASAGASLNFTISSQKQLGIHPVYVSARYKGESIIYRAGVVRAAITDSGARLSIKRFNPELLAGDEFAFDFLDGREKIVVKNTAYTGLEDLVVQGTGKSYPFNDFANRFSRKLNVTPVSIDKKPGSREEVFEASNAGLTDTSLDDPFFLITVEDYYAGAE